MQQNKTTTPVRSIYTASPLVRWLLTRVMVNRVLNSQINATVGREFFGKVIYRLLSDRTLSPASRRFLRRRYVLMPLVQAWKRVRFRRRHGYPPPMMVVISPTLRCNLACKGCFANDWTPAQDMTFETAARVIDEAHCFGTYYFAILGGEPFAWPPLFELMERYHGSTFNVFTNGTLIDAACVARLARMGNVIVTVSVEGFEEETDARRGRGAFAKCIAVLTALRQAGVRTAYSVTATRANNALIVSNAFVDLFDSLGCLVGLYLGYMPVDATPDLTLMPTPAQRDYRRARLAVLQRTKRIILFDLWNSAAVVNGCGSAGKIYLHVNAHGGIEPCPFCHFACDNIRTTSLAAALQSPFFTALRAWQTTCANPLAPCPMIDTPTVLRGIVARTGARPTHASASMLVNEFAGAMDAYGAEYRMLADAAWRAQCGSCATRQPAHPHD